MTSGQEIDHFRLQGIGVLIFIDEDELKLPLVVVSQGFIFAKKFDRQRQQIVEVHAVGIFFALRVQDRDLSDFFGQLLEVTEAFENDFFDGGAGIGGEADQPAEGLGFGEIAGFAFFAASFEGGAGRCGVFFAVGRLAGDAALVDDGGEQLFGVVGVEDGELAGESEGIGVEAEQPVTDRVERAAPEAGGLTGDEVVDAFDHFACGLVGEREQEDVVRGDGIGQQVGDAVGQGARFARASAGDDQRLSCGSGHGCMLLVIEFRPEIDLDDRLGGGGPQRAGGPWFGVELVGSSHVRCPLGARLQPAMQRLLHEKFLFFWRGS